MSTISRREALTTLAGALAASTVKPALAAPGNEKAADKTGPSSKPVRAFYDSLSAEQRKVMCFDWDHKGPSGLPLRLHVTNNWAVSRAAVRSFTKEQQALIEEIFHSVLETGWTDKLHKQAKDDTGKHWTEDRKIAVFGKPGSGRCQVVISGFHLTFRAIDGPTAGPAFGGAICHGHQPSGFHEKAGHPGNIFWYQAQAAHKVYKLLDGKQQKKALLASGMPYYEFDGKIDRRMILPGSKLPRPMEPDVRFRGPKADLPGLPVAEMMRDQKDAMRKVLDRFLSPYRKPYRDWALNSLAKQGGLDRCHLIFYKERTLGKEGEWDNWRVEGPSFVWYFRGFPHVHVWIHVAADPAAPVTSHFG